MAASVAGSRIPIVTSRSSTSRRRALRHDSAVGSFWHPAELLTQSDSTSDCPNARVLASADEATCRSMQQNTQPGS
jgi:hypothetical protein